MRRVQTSSRLHFGLLSLPVGERWPDRGGRALVPARRFGGVGLMVRAPGVSVTAEPAAAWSAEGPMAQRALAVAERLGPALPHRIVVERCAPEHAGLGTGTQLALAVARAVAGPEMDTVALARRVGRGDRSALGIHGFAHGGFLVDGGKGPTTEVAPLLARQDFPEEWRLVLVLPAWAQGLHGSEERQAFGCLQEQGFAPETTDALCRLALLGMLPALAERDVQAFGEALHDFNARVGDAFAPAQGGTYAHARLAEVVEFVRRQGAAGVGQSSWGPTIYALLADADAAEALARRLRDRFGLSATEVFVTVADNEGASISGG